VSQSLKELLLVLAIAGAVFAFARPVALLFTTPNDFRCRRNAWVAVTIAAFLCPTVWLFLLVATFIILWAGRRDSNPMALYLTLLYAVPQSTWEVPMVGISSLLNLDLPMLLSLCLLAPVARRLMRSQQPDAQRGLQFADYCLLAYLALTSVYFLLVETAPGVLMTWTFTNCLRRAVVAFVSVYIPFYVICRSSKNTPQLLDTLAAFCLVCAVMAAIGVFEGAWHWLLYTQQRNQWDPRYNPYLERGGTVRALASTPHALVFGYLLAVAFGLWLSLMPRVQSARARIAVIVLYWLGLLAAYSRGPWLGGIAIYFAYVAVSGRKLSRLLKAAVATGLIAAVVLITPLGQRVAKVVPWLGGTTDVGSIGYREQLADRAWEIIQDSPLLGDQSALLKMQDLRTGGIVDLMNGFVNILLDNGLLGLSLFLVFVAVGLYKGWMVSGHAAQADPELAAIAAALVACLLGAMLMMYAGGLMIGPLTLMVGLSCACARIAVEQHPAQAPQPDRP
jgi:hypothetical protein